MARPEVVPPMWRSRMPVRSTIHSSLVSRLGGQVVVGHDLVRQGDAPAGDPDAPSRGGPGADGVDADEPGVAVDDAAGVDGHARAGPVDLAGAGAAAELGGQLDHLGQPGGAQRVAPPDQAAARVDDEAGRVDTGGAGLGGRPGLARREEAERLEGVELLGRRGVVQLDQVDLVGPERRRPPRPPRRPGSAGRGSRASRFPSGPPTR